MLFRYILNIIKMEIIKKKIISYSFDITFIPRNFVPTLHPKDKEINNLLVSPLRLYKDCNIDNTQLNFMVDGPIEEENFDHLSTNKIKSNVNKKKINTIFSAMSIIAQVYY